MMRVEFWVLEKGPSHNPEWYRKKCLRNHKRKNATNILYADRYESEAEAIANAPDASWNPIFVNWFEEYISEEN